MLIFIFRACIGLKPQNHMMLEYKHSIPTIRSNEPTHMNISLKRKRVVEKESINSKKTMAKKHLNGFATGHSNGVSNGHLNGVNGCR
jgi:hypothetical protein